MRMLKGTGVTISMTSPFDLDWATTPRDSASRQRDAPVAAPIGEMSPRPQSHPPGLFCLRLIGQMGATDGSGVVALPRVRKTRALLAILALANHRPVLREHITSLLWSQREREQARASLRQCVHELQESCVTWGMPQLRTGRQHLQIDWDMVWIDIQALGRATASQPDTLELLQGGLLEDLHGLDPAFDRWLAVESRRVHDGAAALASLVLDQQTAPVTIITAARRLVAIAPTHEAVWRSLIQAYAAAGERAAAIEAYDECALALSQSVDARPSDETTALLTRIRTNDAAPAPLTPQSHAERAQDGVRLGVMVFRATDPFDQATLSVGLADEITNALARFRWINLIAPGSIAALAHEPTGQTERWRALDLDFLLDGSVQRVGGLIRVTVRLLDMRTRVEHSGGEVVWSARFERDAADLFALQDDIAAETAAQVDPELMMRESRRAAARPMHNATAYELLLRAIPEIYRLSQPGYSEAGALLAQAAELAPEDANIHAWRAVWHAFLVGQGWAEDPQHAMQHAGELAERAVALDPSSARALSIAAYVRGFVLHQDIAETIGLHDRALALNPNLPFAWAVSALALSFAGDHVTAVQRAQQARRLSPFDPHSFFFDNALMVPQLMLGEFEAVVTLGRRALGLNPSMSGTCKGLLSALGHLGRTAEATEVLARLLRIEPGFTLASAEQRSPLRRPEDRALYVEGLRLGGLTNP